MIQGMRLSDRISAEAMLCICPENILDGIGRRYGSVFLPYILFCSGVRDRLRGRWTPWDALQIARLIMRCVGRDDIREGCWVCVHR